MFNPILHTCIAMFLAALVLTGFIDLAGLAREVERPGFEAMARTIGGSGTLFILVFGVLASSAVVLGQMVAPSARTCVAWFRGAKRTQPPLSDTAELIAKLNAMFPATGFTHLRLVRARRGEGASVVRRTISIPTETSDALRRERRAGSLGFDTACFVVLHEAMHYNSGDTRWHRLRNSLARALVGVLGILVTLELAPDLAAWLPMVEFPAVVMLASGLIWAVRQFSREVEKDMDRAALAAIQQSHGQAAAVAVSRHLLERLSVASRDDRAVLDGAGDHPRRKARLEALYGARGFIGLGMLWVCALASLVAVQGFRIDPDCNDCAAFTPLLYELAGLASVALLTVVVMGVEIKRSRCWAVSRLGRFIALGAAISGYAAARLIALGVHFWAWVDVYGPTYGSVRAVFIGSDLYALLVSIHFVFVGFLFAFWPTVEGRRQVIGQPPEERLLVVRNRESIHKAVLRLYARLWRSADLAFGAGFMAIAALLAMHTAFQPSTEQSPMTIVYSVIAGVCFLSSGTRPSRLMISLEAIALFLLCCGMVLVLRAEQQFAAIHGLDLSAPVNMVELGRQMTVSPSDIIGDPYGRMVSLLPLEAGIAFFVTVAVWLRWLGEKLERDQ